MTGSKMNGNFGDKQKGDLSVLQQRRSHTAASACGNLAALFVGEWAVHPPLRSKAEKDYDKWKNHSDTKPRAGLHSENSQVAEQFSSCSFFLLTWVDYYLKIPSSTVHQHFHLYGEISIILLSEGNTMYLSHNIM